MSAQTLTFSQAVRIVREADVVKDKSYRRYPLGQEWGRFLRAKRAARCRPNTIESYETVGRLFALRHADMETLEPFAAKVTGPELVLDFLDHYWGESDEETYTQREAVMRSFFEWAYRTDRVSADPMRKIERRRRRRQGPARERIPVTLLSRLIGSQPWLRDQAALLLLGRLALRREDLRLLRVGEIDLARDELYLRHAKGGEEYVLPIAFPDVRETLYLHFQAEQREPREYLLYPKRERTRELSKAGIDGWFRRSCARAGVVGYTMHQLRHAAADDFFAAGGGKDGAQMLLRHEDSATTERYLHRTLADDLRARIRLVTGQESVQLESED